MPKLSTTAMAVVVQEMVQATASGVAFTTHPVHHDASVVVIDLCEGLGDALVSGAKTPDHYVVAKADGSIVRRELVGAHAVLADASQHMQVRRTIGQLRGEVSAVRVTGTITDHTITALLITAPGSRHRGSTAPTTSTAPSG